MPYFLLLALSVLAGSAVTLGEAQADSRLGTRNNPIKVAIVPSGHSKRAMSSAKPLGQCLEKKTKLIFDISVPNSYITVAEAMGTEKVDLAFGNIITYLIAKQKYGVEPLLQVKRYGKLTYQAFIMVRANSPIKTFKDLDGKTFAFPDASSASGFIIPEIEMRKQGIKFSQKMAAGNMEAAAMAVMQEKVDAAAGFWDAQDPVTGKFRDTRARLLTMYPKIMEQTRVIWISDEIPNEPIMIRKNIDPKIKATIATALPLCIEEHPHAIGNIESLSPVDPKDNAYDNFLKSLIKSGIDIASVLNQNQNQNQKK